MFFFGLASNLVTITILGVFSLVFLYQGVSDAIHESHQKNESVTTITDYSVNDHFSPSHFHISPINVTEHQDIPLIYPKFVQVKFPDIEVFEPLEKGKSLSNRAPPVLA